MGNSKQINNFILQRIWNRNQFNCSFEYLDYEILM